MSVSNGQKANQTTFNNAFMSRTTDTNTTGQVDLDNVDAASGTAIANVQRELNGQASFTGDSVNGTKDRLPSWVDNSVGTSSDDLKARSEALTTQVNTNVNNIATKIGSIGSSTDNAIVRWDGTGGGTIQDSGVLVDDSDNVTGVNDLTVGGDLTVNGTTTTVNTATLDVTDANITVNDGGTQSNANTNVAGITVEMSDATDARIGYDSSLSSKFKAGEVGSEAEIVTTSATQTLTSKDYDGGTASNTSRLTVPSDTKANLDGLTRKEATIVYATDDDLLYVDDGVTLNPVGSGTGEGGINHIDNSQFETGIDDWSTYDDGAVAEPVDGTAGSPAAITIAHETGANILRGAGSLDIAKSAADGQGEGVSVDFEIDRQDQSGSKSLFVSFDYDASDANYASGDLRVFVYDVDNATLIGNVSNDDDGDILSFSSAGRFTGRFNTDSTSNSYRLIFHVTSTNASAWNVYIDNVRVSPDTLVPGFIGTDKEEFTMNIDATVTAPTKGNVLFDKALWWRDGEHMWIQYTYRQDSAGTNGSGTYLFPLPSGFSIDTTNYIIGNVDVGTVVGEGGFFNGSTHFDLQTFIFDSTRLMCSIQSAAADYAAVSDSNGGLGNTTVSYTFIAKVKISGWSSGALLSTTENLFKNGYVRGQDNAGTALTADVTPIDFTEAEDTLDAWDGSTYTAPANEVVVIDGKVSLTGSATASIDVYVNGSFKQSAGIMVGESTGDFGVSIKLLKGDTLDIRLNTNATLQSDTQHGITIASSRDTSVFSVFGENELLQADSAGLENYTITAGQFGDLASLPLTPGTWDLKAQALFLANGAITTTEVDIGISSNSGNDSTGLVLGDTRMNINPIDQNSGNYTPLSVFVDNVTVNTNTTYFLKAIAVTSITNLQVAYKITARRIA